MNRYLRTAGGVAVAILAGSALAADQESVRLVATDQLVGQEIMTGAGERIGTLAFVTVSLEEGKLSHLVVDTSDTDGGATSTESQSAGSSRSQARARPRRARC